MTAKDWAAKAAAESVAMAGPLTLPSGMVIQARRPDPATLAMWGYLPVLAPKEGDDAPSSQQILASIEMTRQVLLYSCVSPRISLTPQGDDEIHPREIPDADLHFIIRWALRREEAESYARFRGQSTDAQPGVDGSDVRPAAVGTAGDSGSGAGAGDGHDGSGPAVGGPTIVFAG